MYNETDFERAKLTSFYSSLSKVDGRTCDMGIYFILKYLFQKRHNNGSKKNMKIWNLPDITASEDVAKKARIHKK